jgi:predicted nuclease with RNAse H fold
MQVPTIVALDLAGSPRRPTGFCVLRGRQAEACELFDDEEILQRTLAEAPALVPMDAPLTLPKGRRTIHDRAGEHFRPCDLALRERGIRFFPVTLGPMRMLTERGMRLSRRLRRRGLPTVEAYPGASQDLWGLPRQHKDLAGLLRGLRRLGLLGLSKNMSGHELDAATIALTGQREFEGRGERIGGRNGILLPRVD